jgi:hypothetical protein
MKTKILSLNEVKKTKAAYMVYKNGDYCYRSSLDGFSYIRNGKDILYGMKAWTYDSLDGTGYDGGLRLRTKGLISLRFINVPFFKKVYLSFEYWIKISKKPRFNN